MVVPKAWMISECHDGAGNGEMANIAASEEESTAQAFMALGESSDECNNT
jgi:hypothetical protein